MTLFPTKKLNGVAVAAAASIALVELTAAEREAALKLPRKEALRELHAHLQAKLDAALFHVIGHQLGREPQESDVADGQLQVVASWDDDLPGDTYIYQGTPVLYAGPVEIGSREDEMRASRRLLILNEAPPMSRATEEKQGG